MATMSEVIAGYIKMREIKEGLVKKQKEELAPINEHMTKLENWLHKQLQDQGQKSARTDAGTAFLQNEHSVTVEDFTAMLEHIRATDQWELLERRASKTVVLDLIESTGVIPPGVKVTSEIVCRVRKS